MIKLIALDLDGTVLRKDRTISPRVTWATRAAIERGCYVTIATGRMPISARQVAQALNVNTSVICQNGGIVCDLRTGDLTRRITLDRDIACDALAAAQRFSAWHPVIFSLDSVLVSEQRLPKSAYSMGDVQIVVQPDVCSMLGTLAADKLLLILEPSDAPEAILAMTECVQGRAAVVQSSPRLVEVMAHAAHKGAGLAQLAAQLGLHPEEVMAIGDHDNDETMLAWAGTGVAMGQCSDLARAAANWVAPTLEEDGAAIAIEKFVLRTA